VRSAVVVLVYEGVEQGLQLRDVVRLDGPAAEPLLQGSLEAFDFAAGSRMVRSRILLPDAETVQVVLEAVASAATTQAPTGQAGW
jgi:hypothetical protein